MLITNHVLAGAAIGAAARRRPLLAFVAGAASHLAMDALPHWGTCLPKGSPEERQLFLKVAQRDGLTGLAAMVAVAAAAGAGHRRAVVAAMAGSTLFDADKPCEHFFAFNPFPGWFQRFHDGIQREADHRLPHEMTLAAALSGLATSAVRTTRRPAPNDGPSEP